jgi:hypothetical protein
MNMHLQLLVVVVSNDGTHSLFRSPSLTTSRRLCHIFCHYVYCVVVVVVVARRFTDSSVILFI